MKNEKQTINEFDSLKKSANFESLADIYNNFNKQIDKTESLEDYNKVLNDYNDIITLDKDSIFSLKNEVYSLSVILNRKSSFKIGKQEINYSTNNERLRSKSNNLVQFSNMEIMFPVVPLGILKESEYRNSDNDRRNVISLHHDKFQSTPIIILPTHNLYVMSRQYLRRTFGGWRNNSTTYGFHNMNYVFYAHSGGGPESLPGTTHLASNLNQDFGESTSATYYFAVNIHAHDLRKLTFSGNFSTRGVPSNFFSYQQ